MIDLVLSNHQTSTGVLYQRLHIELTSPDGLIAPQDLTAVRLPELIIWSQGIVLEGRAPIWLYGYLVHACHPAVWVACFDPRLGNMELNAGGAVVVATHCHDVRVGEVLKLQFEA